jgi:hypothetical protein
MFVVDCAAQSPVHSVGGRFGSVGHGISMS